MGYATGQFGKNHLGDLNEFLPTVHGFDEFFGYLYHLDAMEDPAHPAYPQELLNVVGPRNMVHSWATDTDDATVEPRWGKVGKQKIEDAGTLYPKRMETVDDEILDLSLKFMDKAKSGRQAVLRLAQPDAHAHRHAPLAEIRSAAQLEERLDHSRSRHGAARRHRRHGHAEAQGHWAWTTTRSSCSPPTTAPRTSPGPTADKRRSTAAKARAMRAASACLAMLRWPGHVPAGTVENGIISGLDWFPTFVAAAGNPNIIEELKKGKKIGDRTYKNHLDGYNQMDMITGKGPSTRHEVFYFTESTSPRCGSMTSSIASSTSPAAGSATRTIPTCPVLVNLRLDPFERTGWPEWATSGPRILPVVHVSSSGASCSSSSRWASWPRRPSSIRPCRRARASISMP